MTEEPDWRTIPEGRYAVPVTRPDGTTVGWAIWWRHVPRTDKSGRTTGRDRFTRPAVIPADGVDETTVRALAHVVVPSTDILNDLNHGDTYRLQGGKLIGRCGICGKRLTDPESVGRGIGPACWANRPGATTNPGETR